MSKPSRELASGSSESAGRTLERTCALLALIVPLALALPRLGTGGRAETDLLLLRALAWLGNGFTGAASALLVHASFWVPLGSPAYRGALASTVALGLASVAIFRLTYALLVSNASTPRLSSGLALIAALTVALSSAAQHEAELAGGASLAVFMTVWALPTLMGIKVADGRGAALTGLVLGALLAERWTCGVVVCAAVASGWYLDGARRVPGTTALVAGAAGAVLLLLWSPMLLRSFAVHPFLSLDSLHGVSAPAIAVERASGVRVLHSEVGWLAFGLAVAGAALGLARARSRRAAFALLIVVVIDALSGWVAVRAWGDLTGLHLVAFAALAAAIALAIQSSAVLLARLRLPMARGAVVFLVMVDLTLAVSTAEQAAYAHDEQPAVNGEALTDEMLVRAPERAALLISTPAVAVPLLTAQLVDGARPDALLVPTPMAVQPRFAAALLAREPASQRLLRDLVLEGQPREEALTILADVRPVLCELDRAWDRRNLSHLVPERLWLRYAAQPLGISDRRAGYADLRARADALLASSTYGEQPARSVTTTVRGRLVDAAALAAALGDRDELPALLQSITRTAAVPDDPFVRELAGRLATPKAAIDWKSLPR